MSSVLYCCTSFSSMLTFKLTLRQLLLPWLSLLLGCLMIHLCLTIMILGLLRCFLAWPSVSHLIVLVLALPDFDYFDFSSVVIILQHCLLPCLCFSWPFGAPGPVWLELFIGCFGLTFSLHLLVMWLTVLVATMAIFLVFLLLLPSLAGCNFLSLPHYTLLNSITSIFS